MSLTLQNVMKRRHRLSNSYVSGTVTDFKHGDRM